MQIKSLLWVFPLCLSALFSARAGSGGEPAPGQMIIPNKIAERYIPVGEKQFTGLLNEHVRINLEKRLLQIDSAILLSGFEHRPGAQTWIGEHVGKFLFSASYTYRYTQDPRIKALMDDMVKKYIATQLPDGYLGTYLPQDYWTAWDVWAHKYAIIGLTNYYSVTGYAPALEAARRAADLICRTFGDGPGKRDIMLSGEHVGLASGSILEPMVDLYRYTGDEKYLSFARYLLRAFEQPSGPKLFTMLAKYGRVDKYGDPKAYEMLSCLVGALKYYKLTGESKYLGWIQAAWVDIVRNRLYITGTASREEIFRDDHFLPAENGDHMGEGCVTVTWLQLNEQLLKITGEARYVEQIEKTIYNHLFAAENPGTGCVSYYTALQGPKPYKCDQGYSCCLSSVPRGISMIPGLICGQIDGDFSVLLYEPGEMKDSVRTAGSSKVLLQVTEQTTFPRDGEVSFTIDVSSPSTFGIRFRVPDWAAHYSLSVNGEGQPFPGAGKPWAVVRRAWKTGDRINVHFDMPVQVIPGGASYPGAIAFKRGPQVLALDSLVNQGNGQAFLLPNGVASQSRASFRLRPAADALPAGWVGTQAYTIEAMAGQGQEQGNGQGKRLTILVPFADAGQESAALKVWLK